MNNDLKQDFLSLIETLRKEKEDLAQMYQYRLEISLRQETEIEDLKRQIAELEKELSYLHSSCDDSFLNTIARANKLSLKCASLENTIAEFDVYKKDAQEVHDKLTKLYYSEQTIRNNLSYKLWHSRREVAKLKRDIVKATMQIAELTEKYSKADKYRADYEDMYTNVLAQYAELKVKLNAIEQSKTVINK